MVIDQVLPKLPKELRLYLKDKGQGVTYKSHIAVPVSSMMIKIIRNTCSLMGSNHVGQKILTKIMSTMSDQARTETKIHKLVEEYRKEILPLNYENWNSLTEDAKTNLQKLYKFFCGLQLMVGIADVTNATLAEFEKLQGNESTREEEKKLTESVIVRGADPKSGKHKEWRVHCSSVGQSEYVNMLHMFKGNRSNIVHLFGRQCLSFCAMKL